MFAFNVCFSLNSQVLEVSDLQCATDYWGLGCLVYELLTGHKVHHKLRHHSPEEIRASVSYCHWDFGQLLQFPQFRNLICKRHHPNLPMVV